MFNMLVSDRSEKINVAIAGGGPDCKEMIDIILGSGFHKPVLELVGVASPRANGSGYRYAKQKGILTTKAYHDLFKLEDLHLLIELTGSERVRSEILRTKPDQVHLMDRFIAELFIAFHRATDRKLSEYVHSLDSFKKKSEDYWSLYDNAVAALFRTGIDNGSVIMCNERLADILGYDNREEVISMYNVADNYVDHHMRENLLAHLKRFGKVEDFEFPQKRRDGSIFWACLSARIFPEKGYLEGMLIDISERKSVEEENKFLSRRLIKIQEEERKRIARDLHDALGQALSTLQFGIGSLKDSNPQEPEVQRERCEKMIFEIEQIGDIVRRISSNLRPDVLDHLGLIPALEGFIKDFMDRNEGIHVDFQAMGFKKRFNPEVEITLYRLIQEALTNIAKHSKASHASVFMTYSYPKIICVIKDNGVGFGKKQKKRNYSRDRGGIGLLGMRERIKSIGGELEIRSAKGRGTTIRAELSALKDQEGHE